MADYQLFAESNLFNVKSSFVVSWMYIVTLVEDTSCDFTEDKKYLLAILTILATQILS
jgi:hypothetical protein